MDGKMVEDNLTPVFVLCAGAGTRLFPFTEIMPKALLPIGGKPCATIITEIIREAGFSNIIIIHRTQDKEAFEHEFRDKEIQFLSDDGETTASHFKKWIDPFQDLSVASPYNFIIWYGDCLVNIDLGVLYTSHSWRGNDATLVVTKKARLEFGLVKMRGGRGRKVWKMEEKPVIKAGIWTGVAIFKTKSVREFLGEGKDFAYDVFPDMIAAGRRVEALKIDEEWFDIGSYSAYKRVNEMGEFFWKNKRSR